MPRFLSAFAVALLEFRSAEPSKSGSLLGALSPEKAKEEYGEHKEADSSVEPIPLRGKTESGEGHANDWIDEE
jgi:hypothetical protein